MKTIALCMNTCDLGDWRFKEFGKKYPGAGWMKNLFLDAKTFHVMSGREAMNSIAHRGLDPKEVLVIQEEDNAIGQDLIRMGAEPSIITCFESPLYAPLFYDRQDYWRDQFKHSLFFSGGTERLRFPCYDEEDILPLVPWEERKELCAVVSNKHYSMLPKIDSPSLKKALEVQLHDKRYEFIRHQKNVNNFDLYGKGWPEDYGKEIDDKLKVMRKYKFSLCYENVRWNGYVTEKIIDCFIAGTIPIYKGAIDIADFIPRASYATPKDYNEIDHLDLIYKINNARCWLNSHEGRAHSHKGFAENILRLLGESS